MTGDVALIALLFCTVLALAWRLACYRGELSRMAQDLRSCRSSENVRVRARFRTRRTVELARAANELLEAQADERRRARADRKAFSEGLAALSHDIRTPLAGAQGYLELYEMSVDVDETRRAGYLASSRERLDAARALVNELFDYTRVPATGYDDVMPVENVEIFSLLAEVLVAQYPAFVERGWEPLVTFEDELATVPANRDALERVLENLVANALRHGRAAPKIEQRGHSLVFSNRVEHPETIDVTRMFDRFYRADATRRGEGGGLGLTIASQLCTAMGMSLSARLEGDILSLELDYASFSA